MNDLIEHAENEMRLAGWLDTDDEMQQAMVEHIRTMVQAFSDENHSGFSAGCALGAIQKLLNFEPLTPLTGADDEWMEVGDDLYQNKRMSSVFKSGKDGPAYRIDGIVYRDQDGYTFTGRYSRVPVNFPWTPTKPQVVDIYDDDREEEDIQ